MLTPHCPGTAMKGLGYLRNSSFQIPPGPTRLQKSSGRRPGTDSPSIHLWTVVRAAHQPPPTILRRTTALTGGSVDDDDYVYSVVFS